MVPSPEVAQRWLAVSDPAVLRRRKWRKFVESAQFIFLRIRRRQPGTIAECVAIQRLIDEETSDESEGDFD